jgi:hypothetical protein
VRLTEVDDEVGAAEVAREKNEKSAKSVFENFRVVVQTWFPSASYVIDDRVDLIPSLPFPTTLFVVAFP